MGKTFIIMEIDETIKQLLHYAFYLGNTEFYLFVCDCGQIECKIIKEQEIAASKFVLDVWF